MHTDYAASWPGRQDPQTYYVDVHMERALEARPVGCLKRFKLPNLSSVNVIVGGGVQDVVIMLLPPMLRAT